MSWIERTSIAFILLTASPAAVNGLSIDDPPATHSPADCREKRGLWETEFPKIPPGRPSARIKDIEAIAERIGEDTEGCATDLIRNALQHEKARLLNLGIGQMKIHAAAVYTCATLSKDLKCISAVADDTAHLGETLAPQLTLASGQRVTLEPDMGHVPGAIRFYFSTQSSLMDVPVYRELVADKASKASGFTLPRFSEPIVLIAIIKERQSGLFDKFVWLVSPR